MSELVTGDAVVLGLHPARLPSRALAVLIDLIVVVALYIAVSIALLTATASLDMAIRAAVSVATFILVPAGLPIAVETLTQGRSVGKLACGLRVVREDGGPIRFRHALVRGAMAVVEILLTFGVIALIASFVSARGRRLGDVFAGTLVVRERVPASPPMVIPVPPPWLAGRFRTVDLSQVPDGLWLAVRQYLMRREQLDPEVADAMAERLADDLAGHTGAAHLDDLPAELYVIGIAGERHARDVRRVFGPAGGAPPHGYAWDDGAHGWGDDGGRFDAWDDDPDGWQEDGEAEFDDPSYTSPRDVDPSPGYRSGTELVADGFSITGAPGAPGAAPARAVTSGEESERPVTGFVPPA